MAALGWKFDEVDDLAMDDVVEQWRYWLKFPPAHVLLRAMAGYKPAAEAPKIARLDSLSLEEATLLAKAKRVALPKTMQDFFDSAIRGEQWPSTMA